MGHHSTKKAGYTHHQKPGEEIRLISSSVNIVYAPPATENARAPLREPQTDSGHHSTASAG